MNSKKNARRIAGKVRRLVRCEGIDVDGVRCSKGATTSAWVVGHQRIPYSNKWKKIHVCDSCNEKISPNVSDEVLRGRQIPKIGSET